MFSTILSAALQGLQVNFVEVEADVSNGLPMFHLVGYLSSEVKEAGERVRAAIRNSDFILPSKKVIINLSPANMKKKGSIFDLAIAIAVLTALEEIPKQKVQDILFVGELSLDGSVKGVRGILPIVSAAYRQGYKCCVVPEENRREGELVEGIQVIGVSNLREAYTYIKSGQKHRNKTADQLPMMGQAKYEDFADIRGQHFIKRAVEIAVAGGHNLLMIGPPGSGKTAIAKRIPSILPPLTTEESIDLTMIYSIIGEVEKEHPLKVIRPFREVHSSVTKVGMLGGGIYPNPGEISLAHKGVLFLDEIAEFSREVLESLRRPLEDREIRIVREKGEYVFPADFLLVAAMNPCPCGNYPDLNKCTCTTAQRQAYLGKISQPFLERIDICVEVPKVQYSDLAEKLSEESSETIRERIVKARTMQKQRYIESNITTNARLDMKYIDQYCMLQPAEQQVMQKAYERLNLSARTYHKVLVVARTIADLEEKERIEEKHLLEALSYRLTNEQYGR